MELEAQLRELKKVRSKELEPSDNYIHDTK